MTPNRPQQPIHEIILTTFGDQDHPHHAPFGIYLARDRAIIAPYRPSRSLDNLLAQRRGVINFTDDVRVFAGCLTGKRDVSVCPIKNGVRLKTALAHATIHVTDVEEDEHRPRFHCRIVERASHAPFCGFNRAQAAVIEAAVLMSRLHILPRQTIEHDIAHLTPSVEKTAGPREQEAWDWLMTHWANFKAQAGEQTG